MIDSHCHLDHEPLLSDLSNVIQRSKEVGIEKLLTISTSFESFSKVKELINKDKMIYGTIGIHPHESSTNIITSKQIIENLNENSKIIGIGETGLDFYHSIAFKEKQYDIFESHIKASKEFDLPIIIHLRNSEKEIIEVLKKYKNDNLKIVFHCFTGSNTLLQFCDENKYYISLSGIVTFKSANTLRETIKNTSLDHLLIETDSPFLAPTPMRGKSNEPSFVKFTADYLADFYSMQKEEFYKLTDNNFYKLFSRAKQDS